MAHQPHVLSNLNLVSQHFNTLNSDDASRRYYSGQKYQSTFTSRLKILFAADSVLAELRQFYPYQPLIKASHEQYNQIKKNRQNIALGFSAASMYDHLIQIDCLFLGQTKLCFPYFQQIWQIFENSSSFEAVFLLGNFTLFVCQFINQFSIFESYIKTVDSAFLENEQQVKRLLQRNLADPLESRYPDQLLPHSMVQSWYTPVVHNYELPQKWANQVDIRLAPNYTEFEEWEAVDALPAAASGEDEGQTEGQSQE